MPIGGSFADGITISASQTEIMTGDTVTFTITNLDMYGYTCSFVINNTVIQRFSINADSTTTITHTFNETGTYDIYVGGFINK